MNIEDENNRKQDIHNIIMMYFMQHPEQFLSAKREVDNYSLEDRFQKGVITLNDVDWLIANNMKRAAALGLRLSWGLKDGIVYGRIHEGEVQLYEMPYEEGYVHRRIAQMQFDFDHALNEWERFGKEIESGL